MNKLWPVLILHLAEGRRLIWPDWLVTYGGGLLMQRPIPVQAGPDVESLR